jgi:hypothetical protein
MDDGEKVDGAAVIAGCDASKMLKFVKESFDSISQFVGLRIVWNLDFAVPFRRDDNLDISLFDHLAEIVGIVSFIGDDTAGCLAVQEIGGCRDVMGLATS